MSYKSGLQDKSDQEIVHGLSHLLNEQVKMFSVRVMDQKIKGKRRHKTKVKPEGTSSKLQKNVSFEAQERAISSENLTPEGVISEHKAFVLFEECILAYQKEKTKRGL